MVATSSLNDTLIERFIIQAVHNVCETMLSQKPAFVERSHDPSRGEFGTKLYVFGSVGFLGAINGIVYLCIPDDFARHAAGRVLGMSAGEIEMSGDEIVKDVIGEITNMTVGGFKNALCDVGFPCKLTLPTIVRGDRVTIASIKSASRHIFHFDCAGHRLIADIQMKMD